MPKRWSGIWLCSVSFTVSGRLLLPHLQEGGRHQHQTGSSRGRASIFLGVAWILTRGQPWEGCGFTVPGVEELAGGRGNDQRTRSPSEQNLLPVKLCHLQPDLLGVHLHCALTRPVGTCWWDEKSWDHHVLHIKGDFPWPVKWRAGGCRWSQAQGPQQKFKQEDSWGLCHPQMSMDDLGGGGDRSTGGRLSTLERQDPDSARHLGISVAASWLLWQSTPWFTKLEPHCCFSSLYLVDGHSLLHSACQLNWRMSSLGVVKAICKHPAVFWLDSISHFMNQPGS